ncbi:Cytochrome c-550 [Pelagimonas phthalicica]|uniref:Cytochrome c-550 n=1 Tax=Pelagimonas phthalicica TaxID=1037362 RepID=A0A238JHE8_9RHOB|nr:c-type cytochrome [Pelagimonas phthalicica]TDS92185.1 cytochrome c [Pelagimonas phthalicica]SMX29246.1 Cytochrome c-550 [Pelagimonas phthalicica]
MRALSTLAAACLLAGPAMADTFEEVKVTAGKTLFEGECRRCHAVEPTDPSYGPPLENVLYRAAGSVEGYDYSIALEASGIVWTPAALRAWMEDNDGFMPGTKMRHVGIEDRTVQDFILAYLTSISTKDNKALDQ